MHPPCPRPVALFVYNLAKPDQDFISCHDVSKLLDDVFQGASVLFIGQGSTTIFHQDNLEIQHHRVTCGGLAAHVRLRARDQNGIDAGAAKQALER